MVDNYYLVGGCTLPLWKIMEWKSVGMMTFPRYRTRKFHGSKPPNHGQLAWHSQLNGRFETTNQFLSFCWHCRHLPVASSQCLAELPNPWVFLGAPDPKSPARKKTEHYPRRSHRLTRRFRSFFDVFRIPIGSMYGIYANIGGILMVNVTIYSIHGTYGIYVAQLHELKSRRLNKIPWPWRWIMRCGGSECFIHTYKPNSIYQVRVSVWRFVWKRMDVKSGEYLGSCKDFYTWSG